MTRPIVTAAEKKANATRYCTSPRRHHAVVLKTHRKRDFDFLVKTHMKTMKQGRDKAVANANKILDGPNASFYVPQPSTPPYCGYSCTSPRYP